MCCFFFFLVMVHATAVLSKRRDIDIFRSASTWKRSSKVLQHYWQPARSPCLSFARRAAPPFSCPATVHVTSTVFGVAWIYGQIGKYVEAFEDGSSFKRVESKAADMLSRKAKLEARKRAVSK